MVGLEARVPFLDADFLDVAMSINPAEKMITPGRIEKHILRGMYVCMYVYINVKIYVCMYIVMYLFCVCMYVYMYVCWNIYCCYVRMYVFTALVDGSIYI